MNNENNESKDPLSDIMESLKKRAEELGVETDLEKLEQERKERKLSHLENKIAPGLSQWEMVGEPELAGERFVIGRSWHRNRVANEQKYQGRRLVQIDPGVGFGSAHFTTLVCIEAIEKFWQGGKLLDVGTGTGLLAIIASILHPQAEIDAFDISPDIIQHANLHLKINGINNINLKEGTIELYQGKTYDLVIGNLLPNLLKMLKNEIVARVKPGGLLILSGFAVKEKGRTFASFDWVPTVSEGMDAADVLKLFLDLGMKLVEQRQIGEWVGLVLQAPEA